MQDWVEEFFESDSRNCTFLKVQHLESKIRVRRLDNFLTGKQDDKVEPNCTIFIKILSKSDKIFL